MPAIKIEIESDHRYRSQIESFRHQANFINGARSSVIKPEYLPKYRTDLTDEAKSQGYYESRLNRTYNVNITKPIVQEHVDALSTAIAVQNFGTNQAEDSIERRILDDVDGHGHSAQIAYQLLLEARLGQGFAGILVEADRDVGKDSRSYQVLIDAQSVYSLTRFQSGPRRGQISEVVLLFGIFYEGKKAFLNARRYTWPETDTFPTVEILRSELPSGTTAIQIDKASFEVLETVPLKIPKIPFVTFGEGPQDSAVCDVWPLNLAVLQINSLISNQNYHQGLRIVIFTGVNDASEVQPISEYTAIVLKNPNAGVHTVNAGDPAALRDDRSFLMHYARRIGLRQFKQLQDDMSKLVQSAESKSQDFKSLNAYYKTLVDEISRGLSDVYRLHKLYEKSTLADSDLQTIRVSISKDFGLNDTQFELNKNAIAWVWSGECGEAGQEIKREIMRTVVNDMILTPSEEADEDTLRKELLGMLADTDIAAVGLVGSPDAGGFIDALTASRQRFGVTQDAAPAEVTN